MVSAINASDPIDLGSFLRSGALLAADPGKLWIGFGAWERSAVPPAGRLAFFAPDFLLQDRQPWWVPSFAVEIGSDELKASLASDGNGETVELPILNWQMPDRVEWQAAYSAIRQRFAETPLRKAVPVLFERARAVVNSARRAAWLRCLLDVPPPVQVFGLWDTTEGILGATPETLFTANSARRISTMALAGTRPRPPSSQSADAWDDPKEWHEHELVVRDMENALGDLGQVKVGARRILSLALLEHWQTPIELELDQPFDFLSLTRALHPTAALGVWPRREGWRWLADLPGGHDRRRFGAPFGAIAPDGRARCLVAIRNLQWQGEALALGAGCGVVMASECDREWDELALKRLSVKKMLGL